jgi:putative transposase
LTRQRVSEGKRPQYGFRRFEAEAPMQLWQSDFQHTLYLSDPLNLNKRKLAKLCLILDDHSRFVVHGQFYWDEKMPSLEDSLKKAIEKRGIPDQYYCDYNDKNTIPRIAPRMAS